MEIEDYFKAILFYTHYYARILRSYSYSDRTIVYFRFTASSMGSKREDMELDFANKKGYSNLSPELKRDDYIADLMYRPYMVSKNRKDTKLDLNAKVPFNVITRDESVLLKPFDEIRPSDAYRNATGMTTADDFILPSKYDN